MMNMNHHSISVSFGSNLDSSLKPFIKSWEVGKASSSFVWDHSSSKSQNFPK